METVEEQTDPRYGIVRKGDRIPYGTLVNASYELRQAYYYHGYRNDEDLPELPCDPTYEGQPAVDPEEVVARHEMHRVVAEILDSLTRREAQVLRMRFGIGTSKEYTLEEIGNKFKVTRERVRQIEAKALRKIKPPTRRDALAQFVYPGHIKTTADIQREKEKAIERIMAQDIEIHSQIIAKRSTRPELQAPPPAGTSWVDHLKQNAPDVYQTLKDHVDRYADQFLRG